jgi:hypothetical protein
LAVPGLIAKLLRAGVITRHKGDLAFTEIFGKYVYSYAVSNPVKVESISGWREILTGFNSRLSGLSVAEVAAVAILLDYHLNATM